jgi:hypothetical protein
LPERGESWWPSSGIAALVNDGSGLADALAAFDRTRRARCRKIGRLAKVVAGFGADLGGGWRQPARNALLRLAPARLLMRAGTQVVNWTPP